MCTVNFFEINVQRANMVIFQFGHRIAIYEMTFLNYRRPKFSFDRHKYRFRKNNCDQLKTDRRPLLEMEMDQIGPVNVSSIQLYSIDTICVYEMQIN